MLGNSDGGRLLNSMFLLRNSGLKAISYLFHPPRTEHIYPSETEGLILHASCFAISIGVLKGTLVLFQTQIKYSAKDHSKLLIFQSKPSNSLTPTTAYVDSLVYMA